MSTINNKIAWIIGAVGIAIIALALWLARPQKAEATFLQYCHYDRGEREWSVTNFHAGDFAYGGSCTGHGSALHECQATWCNNHQPGDQCSNIDGKQKEIPDGKVRGEGMTCVDETPPPPTCEELQNCPTPPPVPSCTENCGNPPTFAGSSTEPPVCSDGSTTQLPANIQVVRKGSEATVSFFLTQGDSANIYYKVVGQADWQYSVSDVKPNGDKFVSYTIGGLDPQLGYTFGVQQKVGCGGGQIATSVVVDGPEARVFGFSYWMW